MMYRMKDLPPEAVEAAARAIADERWGAGEWVGVPDAPLLRQARAALEAALPLLTATYDRDTIARAVREAGAQWAANAHWDIPFGRLAEHRSLTVADAVLAVLPGQL